MAQEEKKPTEIEKWANVQINKPEIRKPFVAWFDDEIGASTWEDLTEIYDTDDWYELVADKSTGKPLKSVTDQIKIPPVIWKKFVKKIVAAQNGESGAASSVVRDSLYFKFATNFILTKVVFFFCWCIGIIP